MQYLHFARRCHAHAVACIPSCVEYELRALAPSSSDQTVFWCGRAGIYIILQLVQWLQPVRPGQAVINYISLAHGHTRAGAAWSLDLLSNKLRIKRPGFVPNKSFKFRFFFRRGRGGVSTAHARAPQQTLNCSYGLMAYLENLENYTSVLLGVFFIVTGVRNWV